MRKLLSLLFLGMIKLYQNTISPFLGANCRYTPTCSAYGIEAIKKYGPFKGGRMAIRRILSCHPWGKAVTIPYLEGSIKALRVRKCLSLRS